MACAVNVMSVDVLDNPSAFSNPLQFEIQYECLAQLNSDLEWRLTYVGHAEDAQYDQVLDSVLVGPVYAGQYRFVFQADPPDPSKLPPNEIVGITGLLLSCFYNEQEFVRICYFLNNEYPESEPEPQQEPPAIPIISKLVRNILADKPRVTKFPVEFDPLPADHVPVASSEVVSPTDGGFGASPAAADGQDFGSGDHAAAGFGEQQRQPGFDRQLDGSFAADGSHQASAGVHDGELVSKRPRTH